MLARDTAIPSVWPMVVDLAQRALEGAGWDDRLSVADLFGYCLSGELQVWVLFEGADVLGLVLTEIVNYPRKRILSIAFAAGRDARTWLEFLPDLAKWAAENGCTEIETTGRKGWARLAPMFTERQTVYRLELPHG